MIELACRRLKLYLVYLAFVALAGSGLDQCRAEFLYTLGFGQTQYSGGAGQQIAVDFYIRESVSGASVPRFAFGNNDGLFSIGATIIYSSDFGAPATVESLSNVSFAPAFDGLEVVLSPVENRLEITSYLSPGSLPYLETNPDIGDPNSYTIPIGTITFRVGNTPGNNTTVTISNRDLPGLGALDNNLVFESSPGFFELLNIDGSIRGSSISILHVSSVPEPASLWFTLIAAARWRKRRVALAWLKA